jgi:hypothetical protein
MPQRGCCYCGTCWNCLWRIKSANQRARERGDFEAVQSVPPTPGGPRPGTLVRLAPGPFVSGGGFLDYELWDDRERFLELDRLIYAPRLSRPLLRARNIRVLAAIDRGVPPATVARLEGISYQMVRKIKQYRECFRESLAVAGK